MQATPAKSSLFAEVHERVELLTKEYQADGRLQLQANEAQPFKLEVLPRNPRSAPLGVVLESADVAVCSPGGTGMSFDVFTPVAEVLEEVQGVLWAVLHGEYREWVKKRDSEYPKVVARWVDASGGEHATSLNTAIPKRLSASWESVTYEPY